MNRQDRDRSEWIVLELEGDIDGRHGPAVVFACRRELERGRVHILLDLSRVTRVDSGGLGCLVRCCRDARRRGGEIALRRVPEPVLRVLEFTRLDGVFAVVGDEPPRIDGPHTEAA